MTIVPAWLKRAFLRLVDPLAGSLIRRGVHPNSITTLGAVVIAGSGIAFGAGAVRWGGFLVLLSGACDVLDGRVARQGGKASVFGAFYDSTLDRVGEAVLATGLLVWFLRPGDQLFPVWGAALTLWALSSSLIVSYTRARAEGLGLDCRVGIAQRLERVLLLGVPALFVGAGSRGWVLLAVVAVLAIATTITVVQRVVWVWQKTSARAERVGADAPGPLSPDPSRNKG
jgi:CDP-diacylglycerol--glycerol-3-phosphate 3-phosphatidyltransferase